ncbi:hypothetical protein [Intestinimonas butyriciproducens]|uniref:hypothetical protein n=1 Tax=Intestinimonas butyriciproducens TaxID=1297617 RepID=UPI0026721B8F|nr:hypothetical protein [Intestinimonas butyriciproducens]
MTDQELQAIRAIMKEELAPIKEEISMIKEDLEEVRTGVNTLLDWAERTSQAIEFPLPKVIE